MPNILRLIRLDEVDAVRDHLALNLKLRQPYTWPFKVDDPSYYRSWLDLTMEFTAERCAHMLMDAGVRPDDGTAKVCGKTGSPSVAARICAEYPHFSNTILVEAVATANDLNAIAAIQGGGDVNIRTNFLVGNHERSGMTMPMVAVVSKDLECLIALVAAGADLSLKDSTGQTAYQYASRRRMGDYMTIIKAGEARQRLGQYRVAADTTAGARP